ncbi:YqgE/AlgH family protein [Flaviaesturariibacter terrae]
MQPAAGLFLECSDPSDPQFGGTLLYLVEYNAEGAVGVIVNRRFGRALNELEEFRHSPSFPLYAGGPVDSGHLFFLHKRSDVIQGGQPVSGNIFWGGQFADALRGINNGTLTQDDLKIFVGYCGWNSGDLERELNAGDWLLRPGDAAEVFGTGG